jgi:hypothetical protein
MLQEAVAMRDVQPEPPAPAETEAPAKPLDLDAIAEQIAEVKDESTTS